MPVQGTSKTGHSHSGREVSQAKTHMSRSVLQLSMVQSSVSSHIRGISGGWQPNSGTQVSRPLQKLPSSQSASTSQGVTSKQPLVALQTSPAAQRSSMGSWAQVSSTVQLSTVHSMASSQSASLAQPVAAVQPVGGSPMSGSQVAPAPSQRSSTPVWEHSPPTPQRSMVQERPSSQSVSVAQLASLTQPRPGSHIRPSPQRSSIPS